MRRLLETLARNWRLKLAALGIALLLWSVVKAEEIVSVYVRGVPVTVSVRDPAWENAGSPAPARVTLQLTGPVREVLRIAFERPRIVVPVEDVRDSVMVAGLRADWVHLSGSLTRTRVDDIIPASVRLAFHRVPGLPRATGTARVAPSAPAVLGRPIAPAGSAPAAPAAGSAPVSRRDSAAAPDSAPPRGRASRASALARRPQRVRVSPVRAPARGRWSAPAPRAGDSP